MHSVVNIDDPVGKVVGKRKPAGRLVASPEETEASRPGDIDLLIDTDLENEARIYDALATLPDGCVRELDPGDIEFLRQYFAAIGIVPPNP